MEEIILLYALENAFKEGRINTLTIRRAENQLVTEIADSSMSSGATVKIEDEKIVLNTLAVALEQLGVYTPAVENAKGKVLLL